MTKSGGAQGKLHTLTIEGLVPQDNLFRKIQSLVDFSFVHDEAKAFYCAKNGRPSVDPVVVVKYLLIGFLRGIPSERRIEEQINENNAYRWFLGLELDERAPDHSTISQLRRRKFNGTDFFQKIFENIVRQCAEKGLVDGKVVFTDSTHIRACANNAKYKIEFADADAKAYIARLDEYEKIERERLEAEGKIPPKKPCEAARKPKKRRERKTSVSDPDAGILNRPGKPGGFHYLDHQSVDAKRGIIVDVAVTSGSENDAAPYLERVEKMLENGLPIEKVGVDSAYDASLIHQTLREKGIETFTPSTNRGKRRQKVAYTRESFSFDATADAFVCPQGKTLKLRCLHRSESGISREYAVSASVCGDCPFRGKCLAPSQRARKIRVNIFEEAVRRSHEKDGSPEHREILRLRQIWSEGTFAAQKRTHNLKQLFRRGLEAAQTHCLLSATALNLKRMAKCLA
jgi:transposase